MGRNIKVMVKSILQLMFGIKKQLDYKYWLPCLCSFIENQMTKIMEFSVFGPKIG